MIVVDTSALMAIILNEPEMPLFAELMYRSSRSVVAAPTAFELKMVAGGKRIARVRPTAEREADILLARTETMSWEARHLMIARDAFLRFGKGSGHPAKLNFGDCMSYALAKALDAPLLYKGEDFAMTDIRSAL